MAYEREDESAVREAEDKPRLIVEFTVILSPCDDTPGELGIIPIGGGIDFACKELKRLLQYISSKKGVFVSGCKPTVRE